MAGARRRDGSCTGFSNDGGRPPFVELGVASCFSFQRGASDAAELVLSACVQGYDAIGIADLNTLAGVVRLHAEARKAGLRPVIVCRIALAGGETFLAYPEESDAYGRLSRLLSKGKMGDRQGNWQKKGVCDLTLDHLAAEGTDLQLIAVPPGDLDCLARGLPPDWSNGCPAWATSRRPVSTGARTGRGSTGSTGSLAPTVSAFSPPTMCSTTNLRGGPCSR